GAFQRVGQLLELTHDLLGLRPLRRNRRRVGKGRNCSREGKADSSKNVRRLPQLTNDDPPRGNGTGAPGGAGTSRCGRLAMYSDKRQWQNCAYPLGNLFLSALIEGVPPS